MPTTSHRLTALALSAVVALTACGGEERLTDRQLSAELQPAVDRVSAEVQGVFTTLGRAREEDRVPARVRDRLRRMAVVERDTAERIGALSPSERAEGSVDALVTGARRHAATLDRLAGDRSLTVARMADAIEQGEITPALARLEREGLIEMPGHR